MHFDRILDLTLPPGQSAFLWGPRKTGKSYLLKRRFPDSLYFDLLDTDLFLEFTRRPAVLREQILAADSARRRTPIIIDEVQKVPALLDEVHGLIENHGLSFLLCGSSARKLKRGSANLLGGRAWRFELFPLTISEIGDVDLLDVLRRGLVPSHLLSERPDRALQAYLRDYLKEEVFNEGLVRKLPAFSRFFDAIGYSHGELTNYRNIAQECGIDAKTVREYYQILVDTLLGRFVLPYRKRGKRRIISSTPKFYLFDVGVAGAMCRRSLHEAKGSEFGKAFEHLVLMELIAHSAYRESGYEISFWRTRTGLEVDFVLGAGEVAIEVKGSSRVDDRDLSGLRAFIEEHSPRRAIVVCNEKSPRKVGKIDFMPLAHFLEALWSGDSIMGSRPSDLLPK